MRRKASSKENIPVQATGQFASFASGLGGNFLDHPLSGLAGAWDRASFPPHKKGSKEIQDYFSDVMLS